MKVPGAAPPLYKSFSPPFLLHRHLFSQPRLVPFSPSSKRPSSTSFMATCVDTSISDTAQLSRDTKRSQPDDHALNYVNFCRPSCSDRVSCVPFTKTQSKIKQTCTFVDGLDREKEEKDDPWLKMQEEAKSDVDPWLKMQEEAKSDVEQEPILSGYYYASILSQKSLERALANHLSIKLSNSSLPSSSLFDIFVGVLEESEEIIRAVKEDLRAVKERDPACISYVHCFLNFKGFLACEAHRIAHKLWNQGRKLLALLIQNRVSEVFAVDIHPGAKIGRGILLDHATGVVVGETAVIGNNVSILHNVTLGGTGKVCGDRHPKIGDGVLIGAGTCILGNIKIGDGAKIGAGSLVLNEVPPRTTAVGNPARLIGGKKNPEQVDENPSSPTFDFPAADTENYGYRGITVSKGLPVTRIATFVYSKL